MIVHASVKAALVLLNKGVRRHRNDRQTLEARLCPNKLSSRVTIHLGHLQVHQHKIERRRLITLRQDFYRFATMVSDCDDSSGALQQFRRNLLVHLVAFDQQDPDSCGVVHVAVVFLRARTVLLEPSDTEQVHQGVVEQQRIDGFNK